MRSIAIIGSTGSIGIQTLDIVRSFPDRFKVVALTGWNNTTLLDQQCQEFNPRWIWFNKNTPSDMHSRDHKFFPLEDIVTEPTVDIVVIATVGSIGLLPCLSAIRAQKQVIIANKEILVMAGQHIMKQAQESAVNLVPVDSEPSAIWQCLQGEKKEDATLIITASGGSLRNTPVDQLGDITPEQALRHPTWKMGQKITIDSATLMNKAFEVIEVKWMLDTPWNQIKVVVHPQSIIHSMVEFPDGSIKAQLAPTDMRIPIQYALLYPHRMPNIHFPKISLVSLGNLTFEDLNEARYPCFQIAVESGEKGGTYPAVLNAADEVAVKGFLSNQITIPQIPIIIEKALSRHDSKANPSISDIIDADSWARQIAMDYMKRLA